MISIKNKPYIIIILIICVKKLIAETGCGDWETFKYYRCFKVFETTQSYDEAISTCNQYNSTLITITSLEEQRFIENYLFKTNKIAENVWIGLKYANKKYKWVNDLEVNYTNWSEGNPKNKTDLCVQIISDEHVIGKWSDIVCSKKNLALCEKTSTITAQQAMIICENNTKRLEDKIESLTKKLEAFGGNKSIILKTFKENLSLKALLMPYNTQLYMSFNNASELCHRYNATLVEIQSEEKQKIVVNYLNDINHSDSKAGKSYWLGGFNNYGKYKWLYSGNEFNYTNWDNGHPNENDTALYIYSNNGNSDNGVWVSFHFDDSQVFNVFCEITFHI